MTVREQESLSSIAQRAKDGNREAFDSLIRLFEEQVMKTALYLTRNMDDAQDVAQEVYIKIFRNLSRFENLSKLRSWVYRITVNASRDAWRKRRYWEPLKEAIWWVRESDPVQQAQLRNRLGACLVRLPFSERSVFVLRELHEIENSEIASILGCSEVTVRGHLHSARKKLRTYLAEFREGS